MSAIRFVIRGGGAQTTVNGEPFPMQPGDLITTPSLSWHDHYNGSDHPIIWLDGADGPFSPSLWNGFALGASTRDNKPTSVRWIPGCGLGTARPSWTAPISAQPPPYRYRWEDTEKALSALGEKPGDPYDGILLSFREPADRRSHAPQFIVRNPNAPSGRTNEISPAHQQSDLSRLQGKGIQLSRRHSSRLEEGDTSRCLLGMALSRK